LISISSSAWRSARTTPARTTARAAPRRTSGASVATRWLPCVAAYPIASARLVLPCPLRPRITLTPGANVISAAA
jgi:hypothetical protein